MAVEWQISAACGPVGAHCTCDCRHGLLWKLSELFHDDFYKRYFATDLPAFAPEEDTHVHGLMISDEGKALYREAFVSTVKTAVKKIIGRA